MGCLGRHGKRFVGMLFIIVFMIMVVMIMVAVIVVAVHMIAIIMVVMVVIMVMVVAIIAVAGVGIVMSGIVVRRAVIACRVQFRLSQAFERLALERLALEWLGRQGRIGCRAFDDVTLNALAAAAAARIAVARTPAVGTVFVLFLGLAMGALVGFDQGLPVGDRDLIIIRMDFAEGQETVAVTAIFDEGCLQ
jgi:hypothetical protein